MSIDLFICGDIVNKNTENILVCEELKTIIQRADYAICNFEAPIFTPNAPKITKAGPSIFQNKQAINNLKDIGFNIFSLANNHLFDFGSLAINHTLAEVEKTGIAKVGAGRTFEESYMPIYLEKNNVRIAIVAGGENEIGCFDEKEQRSGYAWLLHPNFEDTIRELKSKVDHIIVIAHAGVEDIPIPIKEWRDKYQRFIDIGADIVIGHHPHVPQGYEKYKDGLIFYSLGNFYFDILNFQNQSDDSYSVLLKIQKNHIDFKIVYHKKENGILRLVDANKVDFDLDYLCSLLNDKYLETNDLYVLKSFDEYYYNYYLAATNCLTFKNGIKYFLSTIKNSIFQDKTLKQQRRALLLHNIKIDSHRFVVARALKLKLKQ